MEALFGGVGLVMVLIILAVGFAFQTVFVFLAAKWMDAGKTNFGACFLATIAAFLASMVVGGAIAAILPLGTLLSIIASLALSGFIFSKMLDATFGKGVLIALIASVLSTIVTVVIALVLGGVMGMGLAALGAGS